MSRVKHQTPLPQQSGVVYQISCSCGSRYTGQSDREVLKRITEHKDDFTAVCDLTKPTKRKSVFVGHRDHQPGPDFEGFTVVAREKDDRVRLIKEAIYIAKDQDRSVAEDPTWRTNRSLGADYSPVWLEVVEKFMPLPKLKIRPELQKALRNNPPAFHA